MERRETIEIEETENNRRNKKNKDSAAPLGNFLLPLSIKSLPSVLLNLSFLSFIISLGLFSS